MEDKKIDKNILKASRRELMQKYGVIRRQNTKHIEVFIQNRSETKGNHAINHISKERNYYG